MTKKPPTKTTQPSSLHPRNVHSERYDLKKLSQVNPKLPTHIFVNEFGNESINFFDPKAVLELNRSLLYLHYGVKYWDLPDGYLCPPIPGRADYIHHIADMLAVQNNGKIPKDIHVLDIGTGASCIYPILGSAIHNWKFVASDIGTASLQSAQNNLDHNPHIKSRVVLREQTDASRIFENIILPNDRFELSICNPPFHASAKEAATVNRRKNRNLKRNRQSSTKGEVKTSLNFGGQDQELWCDGGEKAFIINMITESKQYAHQVKWFSTLVSKEKHLKLIVSALKKGKVKQRQILSMSQGNKISRIVAWSYQ